jgi:hypothetical protein
VVRKVGVVEPERWNEPHPRRFSGALWLEAFMLFHKLFVNEDSVLLFPKTSQEKFPLFLDQYLVRFCITNRKLVILDQLQGCNPKISDDGLPVHRDFNVAPYLIKTKCDTVLFSFPNLECEIHSDPSSGVLIRQRGFYHLIYY